LGRDGEALLLREEVVEKWRQLLGDNHLDTLLASNNLAVIYLKLGRAKEAVPLAEEVVKKLGKDHSSTLIAMGTLASAYGALRRHEDALKLETILSNKQFN
ncbi:hypothetical protein CPB86DRAFT_854759, partial [Serendipita vermifera]